MADIIGTIGIVLGIAGIVATIIVGVTIYRKQKKADKRVSDFIEEQHKIIIHEYERKELNKAYVLRRVNPAFDNLDNHYNGLKQRINQHLKNRSEESWNGLKNYVEFFIPRVDSFVTVVNDIKSIEHLLDIPRLKDKYHLILYHGGELKGYAMDLMRYEDRDNTDIIDIEAEMDSVMNYIHDYKNMLNEEVDSTNGK